MPNYNTVTADKVKILNKHFTPGRGGKKIEFITRHHIAGVMTTEQVWDTWQYRQASAHYVIEPDGTVGQLVWDKDTAWANANLDANQRTIAIEHSNSGGAAQDWPISDTVIKAGARWAAALCHYYKLGRPEYGKNIRDHREFGSTACPYHLANGGKYHAAWMAEAQAFYDELRYTTPKPTPAPAPAPSKKKEEEKPPMNDDTVAEILRQLRGPKLQGWPQLGQNALGQDLTLVDAIAALRQDVAQLRKELKGQSHA